MIENWSEKLEKTPSIQMISEVVMAFKAALTNISGEEIQGVYTSILSIQTKLQIW